MKKVRLAALMVGVALPMAAQAFAQGDKGAGQGRAVVTIVAKHSEVAPTVAQQDVSIKVNGKDAMVTGWAPFKGADDGLELVVLIDGGARNLGRQFEEIGHFVQGLGPNTRIAIGYMQNGRAVMAGPLSADHQQAAGELHLPAGSMSNPYFSLSDLARRWPSQDRKARRELVLLSDGIDPNNPNFEADDPYVQAAISDSVRAGLVVYTVYWQGRDRSDANANVVNGGQSLLGELTEATGGVSYASGTGNPVSFEPFFSDLMLRFASQYEVDFSARLDRKPMVETLRMKVEGLGLQVTAPQQVFVDRPAAQ
ncbi:MAG TPA: hypothetical protein VN776_08660 [Terracidiphilus sp.]|nr:hypothetical protein [Terracidiphilus sp.]